MLFLKKYPVQQQWLIISLFYLVFAALAGTVLRAMPLYSIPINYKFLLHSHSHVAMLGWLYGAIFIGLLSAYLPTAFHLRSFKITYWVAQALVFGMLITFIIKGYWLMSIIFSTLHIFIYYYFIYIFIKHIKKGRVKERFPVSLKFQAAALFFLFLSSFGPWSLSVVAAKGLAGSDIYFQSIYFYLHFQYNGLFTFSLLGFLIWLLEKRDISFNKRMINIAFWSLLITTIPAYFLSLLGFDMPPAIIWLAGITGAVQLIIAFMITYFLAKKIQFISTGRISNALLKLVLLLFLIKYILQFISGLPFVGDIAFSLRDVAIGYLHLVMLGMVTIGLVTFFDITKLIRFNKLALTGFIIFLTGFLFNELLLFGNGFLMWLRLAVIPSYLLLLLIMSILMLIGLALFFSGQLISKKIKS